MDSDYLVAGEWDLHSKMDDADWIPGIHSDTLVVLS